MPSERGFKVMASTATRSTEATRKAVGFSNLIEAFDATVSALSDKVAIRTKDDQQTLTWGQWQRRSRDIAGGLIGLGLRRSHSVAILFGNRPEFNLVDLAAAT